MFSQGFTRQQPLGTLSLANAPVATAPAPTNASSLFGPTPSPSANRFAQAQQAAPAPAAATNFFGRPIAPPPAPAAAAAAANAAAPAAAAAAAANAANAASTKAASKAAAATNAAANSGILKRVQTGVQDMASKAKAWEFGKQTVLVLFILVVLGLILVVVVYIIMQIRKSSFEKTIIVPDALMLSDPKRVPFVKPSAEIPATKNGQEFTYSFWLYLSEHYEATSDHKLVFQRGLLDSFGASNPLVFMDSSTNKMYIAIRTNNSQPINTLAEVLPPSNKHYLVGTIDYVPLQRWVHVAFTIQDGNFTIYMDGDIYAVKNIADMTDTMDASLARPILRGTAGDIEVGRASNMVDGYLSKLEFFNYTVSQSDIAALYKYGPIKGSFLKWLGINQYGIRNPVYKLQ